MLLWPSIFDTLSIGTLLFNVIVVAKVCLALWKVSSFVISHISAISFKYAFIF